jgi:DNA-binding LytR/AlgR family response regulator
MTGPLRAFLIDDEPLALRRLARLLEATGRVAIVGRATDPAAGLGELADIGADVLFLDIQMPGLSGFDVVERLPAGPMVVFTTAYDQHAVQAFDANAADYLLKPIERARLDRTLDRLERRRADPRQEDLRSAMRALARTLWAPNFLERLASRVGERIQLLDVAEVTHLVARDRGVYAVTASGEHLVDATLAELERRLDPARFLRIHRAAVVQLAWIEEVHAHFGGRLIIRLRDGKRTEVEVSRDRTRLLKERLGL